MRTAIIIAAGLVLLGLFALGGWRFGGGAQSMVTAAKIFIPVWLAAALIKLLSVPESTRLAVGRRGRDRTISQFANSAAATHMLAVYAEIAVPRT